jgi:hypothetical protein
MQRIAITFMALALLGAGACSSDDDKGTAGTGGSGAGGRGGSGSGGSGSGGSGSGGTSGTGGTSTGGTSGSGGSGTGGASGSGGTGGADAAGETGGGSGGASGDARLDGGGETGGAATMSFFVTSEGAGMGGNLGGLDGADAKCKALAMAVSAALGAKDWKAYLSTTTVNARDRIGTGPWRNAMGVVIASSVQQLHEEGGMMNAIRPTGMPSNALDEKGGVVPMGGGSSGVHDILTGSTVMGTKDPMDRHCTNWTATTGNAMVGHHDRMGGSAPSWNSVHDVGCAPIGSPMRNVTSGGGRGSIYCFATN